MATWLDAVFGVRVPDRDFDGPIRVASSRPNDSDGSDASTVESKKKHVSEPHTHTSGPLSPQEQWRASDQWPLSNVRFVRWPLVVVERQSQSQLALSELTSQSLPYRSGAVSSWGGNTVEYVVDPTACSGYVSRWNLVQHLLGNSVWYGNRLQEDAKLLVFQSAAGISTESFLTGSVLVDLTMDVGEQETDVCIFAYLEDVTPDGKVVYITEGQVRASHRPVDHQAMPVDRSNQAEAKHVPYRPVRTFRKQHVKSLRGRERISFELEPDPSALAGADVHNFQLAHLRPAVARKWKLLLEDCNVWLPQEAEDRRKGQAVVRRRAAQVPTTPILLLNDTICATGVKDRMHLGTCLGTCTNLLVKELTHAPRLQLSCNLNHADWGHRGKLRAMTYGRTFRSRKHALKSAKIRSLLSVRAHAIRGVKKTLDQKRASSI
eukprot:g78272.t1